VRTGKLIHGMSKRGKHHPIYTVWCSMKKRCNGSNEAWEYYGGRGIKVCARWLNFVNFYEDVKDLYVPGLTIDRINNDGDYEPGNVRWVTRKEQVLNRRNTPKRIAQWEQARRKRWR
jgi:hypothetical protein